MKTEQGCKEALNQIEKMNYQQYLLDEGMTTILKYGVACYKKKSRIIFVDCGNGYFSSFMV